MLNDLNKFFHSLTPTRLFLFSLLVISAFWYLNIFLFDRDLITHERFYVSFILSFCLSFLWNLVTLVMSFSLFKKPLHPNQRLYPEQEQVADLEWGHKCVFWNVITSVICLSAFTLFEFFMEIRFTSYILTSFILLILFTGIRIYLLNKHSKGS